MGWGWLKAVMEVVLGFVWEKVKAPGRGRDAASTLKLRDRLRTRMAERVREKRRLRGSGVRSDPDRTGRDG